MSQGKYSPNCPNSNKGFAFFNRNAKGEVPADFEPGTYNQELHFDNYDPEGFDSYGYSAYDADGTFCEVGNGVDRNGFTEMDYLTMSEEEFANIY